MSFFGSLSSKLSDLGKSGSHKKKSKKDKHGKEESQDLFSQLDDAAAVISDLSQTTGDLAELGRNASGEFETVKRNVHSGDYGKVAANVSDFAKMGASMAGENSEMGDVFTNVGKAASAVSEANINQSPDAYTGDYNIDKTASMVQDFSKAAGHVVGQDGQAAAYLDSLGKTASTIADVERASGALTDLKNKDHLTLSDLGVAAEAVNDMSKRAGNANVNEKFGTAMSDVGKAASAVSDMSKLAGSVNVQNNMPNLDFSDFSKGVASVNDLGQKVTALSEVGKSAAAKGNFNQGMNAFSELGQAGNKLSDLSKAASRLENVNFKNADFSSFDNAANTINMFGKSASDMAEFAKTASTLANFQEGVKLCDDFNKATAGAPELGSILNLFGNMGQTGGQGGNSVGGVMNVIQGLSGGGGGQGGNPLGGIMNAIQGFSGGGGTGVGGGMPGGQSNNPLGNIGGFLNLIQGFTGGSSSAAQNVGGFSGFGGLGSLLSSLCSGGLNGIVQNLGKVFSFLGVGLNVFKQIFPPNIKGSAARPSSWRPSPIPNQSPAFLPVSPVPGVVPVPGRDFKSLRDKCLQEGRLYEDQDFPACDQALFFSKRPPRSIEWRRPGELVRDPKLFVEGASRFDVQQGELGDCWLLAAVANLTLYKDIFHRVVPQDQSFKEGYAGIFHFQFWQSGQWVDVVIDDRLPTVSGELVYLHSREKNEFWSALLEKAYAKLHGSYEALKGGSTNEAMEDFTGGLTEMFDLTSAPPNLLVILQKAFERNSLMGCSIEPDPNITEAELPNGLIRGHAYSITGFKVVDVQTPRTSGKIPLLRIRNPWGNAVEWNGAWSDQSPEWRCVSSEERQNLGLVFDDDGEFWMSYQDFVKNFTKLEICNLSPDSLTDDPNTAQSTKKWVTQVYKGSWVRGCSAGGCRNFLQTFPKNPQFCITLHDPDEDDADDKCTCIISLMQLGRRRLRQAGQDLLTIGFALYEIKSPDPNNRPMGVDFFKYNASVGRSPSFINLREVTARFKLPPGSYVIMPSTFEPNEEGEFLLRVFSEQRNLMDEFDEPTTFKDIRDQVQQEVTQQDQEFEDGMERLFTKLAGEDMEVDALELQEILNFSLKKVIEFKFDGFTTETCRSMVAMLDVDHSGRLELDEFKELWKHIRLWKTIFKEKDVNRDGCVNSFELREALHSAGYQLSNQVLKVLTLRYAQKDGTIGFNDFIMCAVKLRTIIEEFKSRDVQKVDRATFTMQEWIEITMYS